MFRRVVLLWVLALSLVAACEEAVEDETQYVLTDRLTVGRVEPIRLDVYKNPTRLAEDRFHVYRGEELVYTNENGPHGSFYLTVPNELVQGCAQDIDGDGRGEVIARYYTGGAHCCWGYMFFSLADGFSVLATIEPGDYNLLLTDLDQDSVAECQLQDVTFHYWHAGNADSPFPRVVFRYRDGGFVLAADLMKAYPVFDEETGRTKFDAAFAKLDRERYHQGDVLWAPLPPETWGVLLNFIYSGKAATGWRLFEEAWPQDKPGLEAFREQFQEQLKKSPHYDEIVAMQEN